MIQLKGFTCDTGEVWFDCETKSVPLIAVVYYWYRLRSQTNRTIVPHYPKQIQLAVSMLEAVVHEAMLLDANYIGRSCQTVFVSDLINEAYPAVAECTQELQAWMALMPDGSLHDTIRLVTVEKQDVMLPLIDLYRLLQKGSQKPCAAG